MSNKPVVDQEARRKRALIMRGLYLLRKAQREGLSVRPLICTLIGYLVIIDSALNSMGWAMGVFYYGRVIEVSRSEQARGASTRSTTRSRWACR